MELVTALDLTKCHKQINLPISLSTCATIYVSLWLDLKFENLSNVLYLTISISNPNVHQGHERGYIGQGKYIAKYLEGNVCPSSLGHLYIVSIFGKSLQTYPLSRRKQSKLSLMLPGA